ncbi:MAG: VCBS repeat-containing protein [Deltaproteobacteria bacterium]|nr:VCBS repeat-containing protein [Deltaproteobacteria bacterium]
MVNAKRIAVFIILSILFILFQAPVGFTQESSTSDDEGSFSSESEVTYTESTDEEAIPTPEEVTTEKSKNSDKKLEEESTESVAPESVAMSMASGGSSSSATGGVFSNPQAVSVSQVGAASFSYPIAVPPGRNGLQPNVSLQYSSYNENGWVGVGWDLDLGSIKRSTKKGLNYSGTDYVANGSELVANTAWGTNFYCEKIEGAFTKYYYNTSSNYWLATAKDGTKYYYGQTSASRMANGSNTYSWQMDRVEDTNGNYMTISYTTVSNQIYPYQISYTGKTGGLSPNKTVEFGLANRTDTISSYKTKYLVTTGKRLQTITVKVDSTTVYKYILDYDNSGPNGRSRLTQIKQVDRTNDSNNLPPTNFTWVDGGDGTFGSVTTLTLNGAIGGTLVFGDINGDGREDFIKVTYSTSYVRVYPYLANSSGGFIVQPYKNLAGCGNQDYMSVALGDIDGDGYADIVSNGGLSQVHAYLSNGDGTFGSAYTTTWSGFYADTILLADLNGDGKADLLKYLKEPLPPGVIPGYVPDNTTIYAGLSNGNGTFGAPVSSDLPTIGDFNPSIHANLYTISVGDVNGDGIPDLYSHSNVLFNPNYYPPGTFANVYGILIGNGSGGFDSTYYYNQLNNNSYGTGKVADVNGDGLADLVFSLNGFMGACLSTGTGMSNVFPIAPGSPNFAISDLNDDGITDIIYESSGNNYFFSSSGGGVIPADGPTGTDAIMLADINGDGRADMIKYNGTSISYSMADGDNAGDQIDLIINPLGGETSITYGNNTDISNNMVPFELHPVMGIQIDDGYNAISLTSYAYSGGYYDYAERDFRGFSTVTQTNPDGTTIKTTYEQLDDYKKGRPLQVDMKNPSGALLKRATFTWAAGTLSGTTGKFVKLTNKRTDIYGTTNVYTNEAYTYASNHGGVLKTVSSGSGGAESVTIENTYTNKGTWLWRKASEKITGSSDPSITIRQTNYTYNSFGNLLTKTYVNTSGSSPVETYTYDTYGNVATYKDPKNNITRYTYYPDDPTYTHVTRIDYPTTGSATHWVTMNYHPLYGKLVQKTDENSQSTYYEYDNYGRLNLMDYPDDGQTIYEYNDTANPAYVKTSVRESTSGYVESYQYVDGFGRAIMAVSKGVGSNYVVTKQAYDNMGRDYYSAGPYHTNAWAYGPTPPSATFPTSSRSKRMTNPSFLGLPDMVTSPLKLL